MKKILLALLALPAYSAMAQMDMDMHHSGKDSSFKVYTFKNIGYSHQEFNALNSRIKSYPQYEELKDFMWTIGAGSIMHMKQFVTINSLSIGHSLSGHSRKKSSSVAYIGAAMDFGYNFFKPTSRIEIYPTVGLGLEGYQARLNKDVNSVSFNDMLGSNTIQNNLEPVRLRNIFFNYRFGLNIVATSPDKMWGFGIQGGYTGSFNDRSWRVNSSQLLQNSPSEDLKRFWGNIFLTKQLKWKHGKHGMMM